MSRLDSKLLERWYSNWARLDYMLTSIAGRESSPHNETGFSLRGKETSLTWQRSSIYKI